MNNYINKLSCWYIEQYKLLVRSTSVGSDLSNIYNMGAPPVREDNSIALASGLSYVQADNPCTTYISADLAQLWLFRA